LLRLNCGALGIVSGGAAACSKYKAKSAWKMVAVLS
jgi:hypothetical protein